METGTRDQIVFEWHIICGDCDCWEFLDNEKSKKKFLTAMRKLGWEKTKKFGWTCPSCIKRNSNRARDFAKKYLTKEEQEE
jgi:hypothetical protein